jgi:hypothetical protein
MALWNPPNMATRHVTKPNLLFRVINIEVIISISSDAFRNLQIDAAIRSVVEHGLYAGMLADSTCKYLSHPLDHRVPDGAKLKV